MGLKKIAIVGENAKWVQDLVPILKKGATDGGTDVTLSEFFDTSTSDFSPLFAKVKNSGAQYLIVILSHASSDIFVKQWHDAQVPIPIGGIDVKSQDADFFTRVSGKANAETVGMFAIRAPLTPKTIPFWDEFVKRFGTAPVYTGVGAYDAVYVYADAVKRAKSIEPDAVIKELEKTDHVGIAGKMVFDEVHDVEAGPGTAEPAVRAVAEGWRARRGLAEGSRHRPDDRAALDEQLICSWPSSDRGDRAGRRSLGGRKTEARASKKFALRRPVFNSGFVMLRDPDLRRRVQRHLRDAGRRLHADLRRRPDPQSRPWLVLCARRLFGLRLHLCCTVPLFIAAPLAVLLVALFGVLMERFLVRPLRYSQLAVLMITLAVSLAVEQALFITFGSEYRNVPSFVADKLSIGGVDIGGQRLLALVAGVLVLLRALAVHPAHPAGRRDPRGVAGSGSRAIYGHPDQPHFLHRDGDLRRHRGAGRRAGLAVPHGAADHGTAADGEGLRHRHRRRAGLDPRQHHRVADPRLFRDHRRLSDFDVMDRAGVAGRGRHHADDTAVRDSSADGRRSDMKRISPIDHRGRHRRRRVARADADAARQQLSHRRAHRLRDLRHLGGELGLHVRPHRPREFRPFAVHRRRRLYRGLPVTVWFANPWYSLPRGGRDRGRLQPAGRLPDAAPEADRTSRWRCCRRRRSCSGCV